MNIVEERRVLFEGIESGCWMVPATRHWIAEAFGHPVWSYVSHNVPAFVPWRRIAFTPGATVELGRIAFHPLRPENV